MASRWARRRSRSFSQSRVASTIAAQAAREKCSQCSRSYRWAPVLSPGSPEGAARTGRQRFEAVLRIVKRCATSSMLSTLVSLAIFTPRTSVM
jgi:hypothetical protein